MTENGIQGVLLFAAPLSCLSISPPPSFLPRRVPPKSGCMRNVETALLRHCDKHVGDRSACPPSPPRPITARRSAGGLFGGPCPGVRRPTRRQGHFFFLVSFLIFFIRRRSDGKTGAPCPPPWGPLPHQRRGRASAWLPFVPSSLSLPQARGAQDPGFTSRPNGLFLRGV
jgi:hypothetical protein